MERILIMRHLDKNMAIGMCHRCGEERVWRVGRGEKKKSIDINKKTIYIYNEITYACMACGTTHYEYDLITEYPMDWSVS